MVKKLEIKHSQQIPEFPFREIVNGAKPKMYAAHYKPPAVGTGRADEHLHGKKERKKKEEKNVTVFIIFLMLKGKLVCLK